MCLIRVQKRLTRTGTRSGAGWSTRSSLGGKRERRAIAHTSITIPSRARPSAAPCVSRYSFFLFLLYLSIDLLLPFSFYHHLRTSLSLLCCRWCCAHPRQLSVRIEANPLFPNVFSSQQRCVLPTKTFALSSGYGCFAYVPMFWFEEARVTESETFFRYSDHYYSRPGVWVILNRRIN